MQVKNIGTSKTKQGDQVDFFYTPVLAFSPIYSFFLKQMAELIESGLGQASTTWQDNHCQAIYAIINNSIVGHIVFSSEYEISQRTLWIKLSAVDKNFRGQGIYTQLHNQFELIAKSRGCTFIASHVHKNNDVRLKSAEKVGMKSIFYFMSKRLD